MKEKSLKLNAALYGIKIGLSILFPLITFPYASRILQVENIGKINFSNSIISYFSLIAALGVSTYAIREGAGIRTNQKKLTEFANEIFTINVLSTLLSYLLLAILIVLSPRLQNYMLLLFIQSIAIIFTTIGVDWIYSIYEDYFYITVRTLIFQLVSLILLFILVHTKEDYYLYALVMVISNVGANILNFIHSRKYFKIKLTKSLNLSKHIKSILIIFSTSIATTIYVNSDLTMLGLFSGDYSVGLYSVSVKIYMIVKLLMVTVVTVALPRLSFYIANGMNNEYNKTLSKIFNSLIILVIPAIVGINILCEEIILILSGKNYLEASSSLHILSISLIFSILAIFTTSAILLPMKKEIYILKATIISAIVNVLLNFFLIPLFKENGAAISTVIAEFLVLSISYMEARKYVKLRGIGKNLFSSIIGCLFIFIFTLVLKKVTNNLISYTILTTLGSVVVYYLVLLLFKNQLVLELTDTLKRIIIR